MRKRIISLLLVLCMLAGLIPTMTPQAQALDLMAVFDVVGPIVRGAKSAYEDAKTESWNFGQSLTGTFKSIGKELLGMDDDESPGTTVQVETVDLSEVELQLEQIQSTLESQGVTLTQIKDEMDSNMDTISQQLAALSNQIADSTTQLKYYTYLTNYFEFYNEFYEAVSYYDQALTTLYASNPTQENIKNTFDQFYELRNVTYTGNFYSSIERLGKYLRGEYISTDPGSVVNILCAYYELAGYSEQQTADAVKSFVAQTYYTYCLATYYYLSVALFQDTYINDGNLTNYTTDFGTMLNATQINQLTKSVLDSCMSTTVNIFYDLNAHFSSIDELSVNYQGTGGTVSRTISGDTMDVEPGSVVTMPDTAQLLEAYLGSDYISMFDGVCTYSYTTSSSNVTSSGNHIFFGNNLADGATVTVQMHCTASNATVTLHEFTFTVKKGALGGGYGTFEYPYVIKTTDQFKTFASSSYKSAGTYVSLVSDLDFGGDTISSVTGNFAGVFMGNGHSLSNFTIEEETGDHALGLFRLVSGTVQDLSIRNARIQYSTISYSGTYYVGGIVGKVNGGKILCCDVQNSSVALCPTADCAGYVGGIAGEASSGTITGCLMQNTDVYLYAFTEGSTSGAVGGLVGYMTNQSTMSYCGRNDGQILTGPRTTANLGGLVGEVHRCWMNNCWSYKTTASYTDHTAYYDGGTFVGLCEGLSASNWIVYNGTDANSNNYEMSCYYKVTSGATPTVSKASDLTLSAIGYGDASYLTNDTSSTGNPIRLVSGMSTWIDLTRYYTFEAKTSYYYGEPLSLVGLYVGTKRGNDTHAGMAVYTVSTDYNSEEAGTYTVTITANGNSASSCSYTVTVAEKPHVFVQKLEPSTCTEAGSVYYVCQDEGCDATFDIQTLPARGHMLTHYDEITATCDQLGQREYWYCTTCGSYFLDEDATQETTEANLAVTGTSHSFGQPEYTWAKTDDGYICIASVSCTRENCPEYATTPLTETGAVTVQIVTEPTCAATGLAIYTATFTNSPFTTQTHEVTLPTLTCPSAGFTDVPGATYWSHAGIDYCVSNGLMGGFPNGTFLPGNALTRAQLVTILYREAGSPDVEVTTQFSDVPATQWYAKAVSWAAANGIVTGYPDGTFLPNNPIKRQEIAAMLYRLEGSPDADTSNLTSFPDYNAVQSWVAPALSWAVSEGLITGVANLGVSYLKPTYSATREQFATIIMRYLTNG